MRPTRSNLPGNRPNTLLAAPPAPSFAARLQTMRKRAQLMDQERRAQENLEDRHSEALRRVEALGKLRRPADDLDDDMRRGDDRGVIDRMMDGTKSRQARRGDS